jgi:hypothetical protein
MSCRVFSEACIGMMIQWPRGLRHGPWALVQCIASSGPALGMDVCPWPLYVVLSRVGTALATRRSSVQGALPYGVKLIRKPLIWGKLFTKISQKDEKIIKNFEQITNRSLIQGIRLDWKRALFQFSYRYLSLQQLRQFRPNVCFIERVLY